MSKHDRTTDLITMQFDNQHIRMWVDAEGVPWWIAQDVGLLLGLKNVRKNVAAFSEDEKGVTITDTPGGPQVMVAVNEPGLYRLIFLSRKPAAQMFQRWIFREVLPTLRRTGTYSLPERSAPVSPHLPPVPPRLPVEMAHVSEHLLGVWRVLREAHGPLSNREIALRAGVACRTARAHTRYLLYLGLVDLYEAHYNLKTFP